jgi:acyl-CoA reductase-like NAD-dependent aldehyde dehydrogenase
VASAPPNQHEKWGGTFFEPTVLTDVTTNMVITKVFLITHYPQP